MRADHETLVRLAATWLRRRARCTVVLANFQSVMTAEQPDAIGWRGGGWSIVIEAKASRADFRRDECKPHRRAGRGMGQERYYIAPPGVVVAADLDPGGRAEGWGLLEADVAGRRVAIVRATSPWPKIFDDEVCRRELPLLLAAMRRLDRTGSLASADPLPPLTDGDLAVFEDRIALARAGGDVEALDQILAATAALCAEVRRHRRASSG